MKLAVCLFVKDEARDIAEWVAYHHVLGFDALLIYDNGSTDGTSVVLDRLAQRLDLRRTAWLRTDADAQRAAYQDAVDRFGPEFDWMLFIDADEFFAPVAFDSAPDFLASLPHSRAVALNWAMFGSSGHQDYPPGLVIENFVMRAGEHFASNDLVKSFVRPEAVIRVRCAHVSVVDGGYSDASGRPAELRHSVQNPPQLGVCRIHHYFLRSRAHWRDKLARGYRDWNRREDEFEHFDRNKFRDETAARFAPQVRASLEAWDMAPA